jgi:hypothetical protein
MEITRDVIEQQRDLVIMPSVTQRLVAKYNGLPVR